MIKHLILLNSDSLALLIDDIDLIIGLIPWIFMIRVEIDPLDLCILVLYVWIVFIRIELVYILIMELV